MLYTVEILSSSLTYKATVHNLVPLDKSGNFLEYTQKLSDWGICRFRIGTKDPLLASEGDILKPFQYHVRVKRAGVTVWQGAIVRNPYRTRNFIEVEARTYLYLLSRVLVKHDPADGNSGENYRTFKSGFIPTVITTLLGEVTGTQWGSTLLSSLTAGTLDFPQFPADFKDSNGTALSGTWVFSDTFQLKFDYRDFLYVLQLLAAYSNFDFEVTNSFVLNFQKFLGNRKPELVFTYGNMGQIQDYNTPLDGDTQANHLTGIAADNASTILTAEEQDATSINTYGKIMSVAAYSDVKNINLLRTRLREELTQIKNPDPEIHITLNDRAYPLGQYGIGDIVTINIQDHVISVNQQRRIVGINIKVDLTGNEEIRLITNKPREGQ